MEHEGMVHQQKTQESTPRVVVDFPGHDRLEAHGEGAATMVKAWGCRALKTRVSDLLATQKDPALWPLPTGHSHPEMLIREFILRLRGEWDFPYKEDEVCHCRSVPTAVVDQAILNGAHTTTRVSARTSASTSCGTCRPDVQKIIDARLKVG